jgi:ribosomal protein L15
MREKHRLHYQRGKRKVGKRGSCVNILRRVGKAGFTYSEILITAAIIAMKAQ